MQLEVTKKIISIYDKYIDMPSLIEIKDGPLVREEAKYLSKILSVNMRFTRVHALFSAYIYAGEELSWAELYSARDTKIMEVKLGL